MRKFVEPDVADNPLYHDTWKLLKKYRDVVWSLELSVQHVRTKFEIEYGTSIEDFLDSVYLAGADLAGSDIEHHAKCIERSHKMLKLLDSAIELLRTKHKNGEDITGCCTTPSSRRSSSKMLRKSSRPYDRIFVTSVSEPTTANAGKLLKPSVPFFGAIPPRTV